MRSRYALPRETLVLRRGRPDSIRFTLVSYPVMTQPKGNTDSVKVWHTAGLTGALDAEDPVGLTRLLGQLGGDQPVIVPCRVPFVWDLVHRVLVQ